MAEKESGTIKVALERAGGSILLVVEDDGNGLPEGFVACDAKSIGMRISFVLSHQLDARLSLDNIVTEGRIHGARMILALPEPTTSRRA